MAFSREIFERHTMRAKRKNRKLRRLSACIHTFSRPKCKGIQTSTDFSQTRTHNKPNKPGKKSPPQNCLFLFCWPNPPGRKFSRRRSPPPFHSRQYQQQGGLFGFLKNVTRKAPILPGLVTAPACRSALPTRPSGMVGAKSTKCIISTSFCGLANQSKG